MKKTLITLLAFAGLSTGAEQVATLDGISSSCTFSHDSSAYVVCTLDLEDFKTWVAGGNTETVYNTFVSLTLDKTDASGGVYSVGVGVNNNMLKGTHDSAGNQCSHFYTGTGDLTSDFFATMNTCLATAQAATLTLTYYDAGSAGADQQNGVSAIFAFIDTKNEITTKTLTIGGLRWENNSITGAAIDTTYIAEADVYSGSWTSTEVTTAYTNKLYSAIPEPATATLSLLALTGLAMRRRRK